ncbi:MAG: biotin-dependent carboxyltransferase family protein [Bacteroidota bacterium]
MIRFLASGLYTSLQDLGRFGYRNLGVPVSGAMDLRSATRANLLVGNEPQLAVMELTASGPVLEFEIPAVIAVCGASFTPELNGNEITMNRPIEIPAGGVLSFGRPSKGLRAYLAVQGGFISEKILGSSSFYNGITSRSHFAKGDVIRFNGDTQGFLSLPSSELEGAVHFETSEIVAFRGPEFNELPNSIQLLLNGEAFTVAPNSNRMACFLNHSEAISAKEIVTAPVQPGTVQLTPSGKIIVLMRDAQTTGGYARILQLTDSALNILAQKRTGMSVYFKIIDPLSDIRV